MSRTIKGENRKHLRNSFFFATLQFSGAESSPHMEPVSLAEDDRKYAQN
jgi:hypothetical protein